MKTYNTYQEAKIDNPNSEIYEREEGVFATESLHREPCNPKDYCMSLESFLASGKVLVRGDLFIGFKGKVSTVVSPGVMNVPQGVDSDTYILKAKALENPAHEWVNGDECVHGHHNYSGANKMTYIGAHPFANGKHVCLSELKGLVIVDSMWLRKPETPEQKLEREELEAACDLWEKIKSEDDSDWSDMPISFQGYILSAVKTTGYRKETKS